MLKRLRIDIIQHIRQNIALYLIILFALLTGIASGSFTAGGMTETQRTGLGGYMNHFFAVSTNQPINKAAVFWESLWQHLRIVFLVWLAGLFFFGIPFIPLIIGFRSFFIGFTFAFLVSQYKLGGFLFALVCMLPQTIIYVLCLTGIGVIALEFSIWKFKNRKISYSREQRIRSLKPYTFKIIIFFVLLTAGSLIEAYVTPSFFSLFRWVFN